MMARYGDNAIDEVRQRADIVEIIGAHVRLRRTGRNFVGLCPFHNEKTPSFSVNPERGFYHCFGCNAGGTVFNFIMKVEGLTFPEAIRSLATRYGVSLPELKNDGPAAAERDALARANQTAAEFYAHVLWNTHDGELAREYLHSRGITIETARAFMLGFSPARPASLAKALEKRGLTEAGIKAGVVKTRWMGLHDAFRARVMFPIRDAQGKVIAFGGRVLDARMPKYLNSPESPPTQRRARCTDSTRRGKRSHRRIASIIVEGYFDVIALWQAGFRETVASCGTSLTVEQLRLLSRYTKNVFACFDGDDAGRKASLRALEIFLQAGLLGRGIFIPAGFDPDTLVRERGAGFRGIDRRVRIAGRLFPQGAGARGEGSLAGRARAAERLPSFSSWSRSVRVRSVGAQSRGAAGLARKCCARPRAERHFAHDARCASLYESNGESDARLVASIQRRRRKANWAWSRSRCCIPMRARLRVSADPNFADARSRRFSRRFVQDRGSHSGLRLSSSASD